MKKALILIVMVFITITAASCGKDETDTADKAGVTVDYGSSKLYSNEEIDAAIEIVKTEFSSWEGCELHSIKYAGDECNSEENIKWLNDLSDEGRITSCIELLTDFHSPKEGDAWEPDKEFTGWKWWLGRLKDGKWVLLTWEQ